MSSLPSWLLGYLLNSLWQVPLLFGVAWIAARILSPLGSAAQHRVWVSAVLLESLLPAVSASPATWLRSLHLGYQVPASPGNPQVTVVVGPGTGINFLHLPSGLLAVVALLYTAVLAFAIVRFAWRARRLLRLRSDAQSLPLTEGAARCWSRCSQHFHLHSVELATSSAIFGPIALGLRHPLILLPLSFAEILSADDLETVLAHEFAHLERHDLLKNLLYELVALPLTYHPFLWLTRARLVESREMVCDELAARLAGPTRYAHSLLRLASLLLHGVPSTPPHAIGIFDANTFERRLMKLTRLQNPIHGIHRILRFAICGVLGVGVCGSALALRVNVAAGDKNPPAASRSSSAPIKVSSGLMAGQLLTHVNPVYPEAAKTAKIQGTIVLHAVIGKEGTIEQLQVVSGPAELRTSALDAVHQWVYTPYRLNGEATEVETTINVTYSLEP